MLVYGCVMNSLMDLRAPEESAVPENDAALIRITFEDGVQLIPNVLQHRRSLDRQAPCQHPIEFVGRF